MVTHFFLDMFTLQRSILRRKRHLSGLRLLAETVMIQLNPPIPMNTPKGEGFAHVMLDYGPESDLYWVVLITETGEIWTYANRYVRASKNITLGRLNPAKPSAPSALTAEERQGERPIRPRAVESYEPA
jgi:hypothetical protein